jgi:hypothetical protein
MEWIQSTLRFKSGNKRYKFQLVHFDNPLYPVAKGEAYTGKFLDSLEKAEDELGSVLWIDAINLFLPFVCSDISLPFPPSLLCLGEGTGACGIGMASTKNFARTVITDLDPLLPLLSLNASLNPACEAHALDWRNGAEFFSISENFQNFDVVIGCEVLYGNRFAWPDLLATILASCRNEHSLVYLCVTLRNARHDLEDFWNLYLARHFSTIIEIPLSESVSVIKATRLVR